MKKTILFSLATVFAFFLLSEMLLRFFLAPLPSSRLEWPPPDMTKHGMMADEALFWKLRPGYNEPWRLHKLAYTCELKEGRQIDWQARQRLVAPAYEGVRWQVNDEGFRGPGLPETKDADCVRILFLGSSITFGWGVRAEEAFAMLVGSALAGAFPQKSFEVVNGGVPGYSSYQGLQYLKMLLPAYQPDVVVAEFGINDGTMAVVKADKDWRPRSSYRILRAARESGWGRLVLRIFSSRMEHSAVELPGHTRGLEEARKAFYRISMSGPETRVSSQDFKSNLEAMASLCLTQGSRFFFFVPSLYNEYGEQGLLRSVDFTAPNAIPVHERLQSHSAAGLEALFLPFDEAHLSVAGHLIAADAIAEFLGANASEKFEPR